MNEPAPPTLAADAAAAKALLNRIDNPTFRRIVRDELSRVAGEPHA